MANLNTVSRKAAAAKATAKKPTRKRSRAKTTKPTTAADKHVIEIKTRGVQFELPEVSSDGTLRLMNKFTCTQEKDLLSVHAPCGEEVTFKVKHLKDVIDLLMFLEEGPEHPREMVGIISAVNLPVEESDEEYFSLLFYRRPKGVVDVMSRVFDDDNILARFNMTHLYNIAQALTV